MHTWNFALKVKYTNKYEKKKYYSQYVQCTQNTEKRYIQADNKTEQENIDAKYTRQSEKTL